MRHKIVVATTNPGKIVELRAMLEGDIEWLDLEDFPGVGEVEEDGLTFAENACKKALYYSQATGLWTIADDSGLAIDALGGEPGVRSARYSGLHPEKNDRTLIDYRNIEKVLGLLEAVPEEARTARFVCCLALASPESILAETEGVFEGIISEQPMGENGFGYDPIFFVPGLNKTVAQIDQKQKNAISHRGSAIRKLKPLLDELLKSK